MKTKPSFAIVSLAALAFVGSLGIAKADVKYVVSGTFEDGATLSGYFDINVYGYVGNYDLTTTLGTLSGATYTSGIINTLGSPSSPPFSAIDFLPGSYDGALQLTFSKSLGSYGADPLVTGTGGPSWENVSYTAGDPPIRYLTSGVATGVPEPSTWAMMLLGFAGLGFAGYRQTKRKNVVAFSAA